MTFLRSILVLITSIVLILVPYAWGHALSNHHSTPVVVGAGAAVLTLAFAFVLTRRRSDADRPH